MKARAVANSVVVVRNVTVDFDVSTCCLLKARAVANSVVVVRNVAVDFDVSTCC